MNFVFILFVILLCLSLSDFIFLNQKKLNNQIYKIAFFISFFFVSIKYYFGPDISFYIQLFDELKTPLYILQNGIGLNNHFEFGFVLFFSVLKFVGFSLWAISFIITICYFYAIHLLFKQLIGFKTFALFLLVLLDYNLLIYEFRQCLAVSFFIFGFISYADKKYFKAILFAFLSILMHKSAIFICISSFLVVNIKYLKVQRRDYIVLLLLLSIFVIFSFSDILLKYIPLLPLNKPILHSISFHFLLSRNIQTIFIVYFLTILSIAYYGRFDNKKFQWHMYIFFAFVIIVLLYQDWFLLNRLRSYFLPFILVYVINLLISSKRSYKVFVKQILVVCIYLFAFNNLKSFYISQSSFKSGVAISSTIFDRLYKTESEIKKVNLRKADIYWKKESAY